VRQAGRPSQPHAHGGRPARGDGGIALLGAMDEGLAVCFVSEDGEPDLCALAAPARFHVQSFIPTDDVFFIGVRSFVGVKEPAARSRSGMPQATTYGSFTHRPQSVDTLW